MFFVAHPDLDKREVARALAMLDEADGAMTEATDLFPAEPHEGPCRICGEEKVLDAQEHVPPRGAFNKHRGREVDVVGSVGSDSLDEEPSGRVIQGGVRGYTICGECNNLTGARYGREYQEWARWGIAALRSTGMTPAEIDEVVGYPTVDVGFRDVYPGRFIRQVLSLMLSISGSPALGERYPDVRDLVLAGAPRALPEPLRIYFNLYADGRSRIAGGPNGHAWFSHEEDVWRRILKVSFPPLSTILLIEGPPDPSLGVDITLMTEMDVDARAGEVHFEGLLIGFGHKPFPGDFRTRGQLISQRDTADTDTDPDERIRT